MGRTLPLFTVFGTTWKVNSAPKRHAKAPKEESALEKKADSPKKSPQAQKLSFNAPDPVAEETKKPEAPPVKAQMLSFKTKPKEEYNPTRSPVPQDDNVSPDEYNPTRPPVTQEEPPKKNDSERSPMNVVFG